MGVLRTEISTVYHRNGLVNEKDMLWNVWQWKRYALERLARREKGVLRAAHTCTANIRECPPPPREAGMATKKKTTLDTFKDRNRNHVKNETQLSKYIWELKYKNTDYTLTWDVERKSNLGPRKSGLCNLCLEEKYKIIRNKEALNIRLELISKCRHRTRPTRKPPEHEYDLSHRTRSQTGQPVWGSPTRQAWNRR